MQATRCGDNLEIVLWLYNLKGDKYLLDLAELLARQTKDWHNFYLDGSKTGHKNGYPEHIVNLMQGLKAPPLKYLVSGETMYAEAFWNALRPDGRLWKKCGRVDGMLSGTEPITDRSSTQGTELCAIVDRILSNSVADHRLCGLGLRAD